MMRKTPMPRPSPDGSPACVRRAGCLRACPPSRRPGWPGCAWPGRARARGHAGRQRHRDRVRTGPGRAAGRRRPVQPVSARSPPAAQRGLLPRRAGRGRAVAQAGSGAGFGAGRSAGRAQAPGRGRRARGDGARPAFGRFAQGAHPRRGRGAGCAAGRRAHDRGSGPRAGPRRGAARQARARHAADQSWRRAAGGGRATPRPASSWRWPVWST